LIALEKILHANTVLKGIVRETPLFSSNSLNQSLGVDVFFKAESEQHTGSFKIRGAYYCMHQHLMNYGAQDVVAYSSGNHAQGVALAGSLLGLSTTIVMPRDAPKKKIEGTRNYGANIITYDRYTEDREQIASEYADKNNAFLVPPYNHEDVIAGQSTVATEAVQQMASMDLYIDDYICPVGGGGLIAGCSLALKNFAPKTRIYGVEPKFFNDTQLSFSVGSRQKIDIKKTSICDALMVDTPGELTFPINQQQIQEIFTVDDDDVIKAMTFAYDELGIILEPSGAVGLALMLKGSFTPCGKTIVVVLSGGNIDASQHQKLIK
jgi:threonine dehydratase